MSDSRCECEICATNGRLLREQLSPYYGKDPFRKSELIAFLNSDYTHKSKLHGTIDTVEDPLRKFSEKIGFEIYNILHDSTARDMLAELNCFADHCIACGILVVFFYLGGHGIFGDSPILLGINAGNEELRLKLAEIGISEKQLLSIFSGITIYIVNDTCLNHCDVKNPNGPFTMHPETNVTSLRTTDIFERKVVNSKLQYSRVMSTLQRKFDEYAMAGHEYTLSDVLRGASKELHKKGDVDEYYKHGHTQGSFDFRAEIRFRQGKRIPPMKSKADQPAKLSLLSPAREELVSPDFNEVSKPSGAPKRTTPPSWNAQLPRADQILGRPNKDAGCNTLSLFERVGNLILLFTLLLAQVTVSTYLVLTRFPEFKSRVALERFGNVLMSFFEKQNIEINNAFILVI